MNGTQAIGRIEDFTKYYAKKSEAIESELEILSASLDNSKSEKDDLKIKADIEKHLIIKKELDNVAEIFFLSLIPLKSIQYVNTKD